MPPPLERDNPTDNRTDHTEHTDRTDRTDRTDFTDPARPDPTRPGLARPGLARPGLARTAEPTAHESHDSAWRHTILPREAPDSVTVSAYCKEICA